MLLSGGGTGELEPELELEPEVDTDAPRQAAAAAAHSRRLSASFFSLGIPGDEQEDRGDSRLSGVWQSVVLVWVVVVLKSGVLGVTVVKGTVVLKLTMVLSSALVSARPGFSFRIFDSCWGVVVLLTEMNALPGVEKGRGP